MKCRKLKKSKLEIKKTLKKEEYICFGLINSLDMAKERISKLQNKSDKTPQMICKEKKYIYLKVKQKETYQKSGIITKRCNIHAAEISEVEGKRRRNISSTNDEFSKVKVINHRSRVLTEYQTRINTNNPIWAYHIYTIVNQR